MASSLVFTVNRELIETDLNRIASALSPLIVSRLESVAASAIAELETSESLAVKVMGVKVNAGPLVARMVRTRLSQLLPLSPASVTPLLSDALRRLLELSDPELSALCETVATEAGAWVGAMDPVPPAVMAAAARPLAGLVDG